MLRRLAPYTLTIALVLVLEITGALHVYGLGSLAGQRLALGAALLLLVIAGGWLMVSDRHQHLPRRMLLLLVLLAWVATTRDLLSFIAPQAPATYTIGMALGGALLVLLLWRAPAPIYAAAVVAALGSIVRLVSYAHVPITPERGDMLPLVQGALTELLAGRSPYTIYTMPWELPLTYLPLTWLAYLPAWVLGVDIRLTNLLAELAIAGWLAWLAAQHHGSPGWRTHPGLLLWAVVFLLPTSLHWSQVTTGPVQWLALCAVLALLAAGRHRLGAFALGLAGATSPLTAVVAPFALLTWLRSGWRAAAGRALVAALVALVCIAPFLLWAPGAFVYGAWRWFNDNTLFPALRWEMDHTWARMVGFSGVFWRRGLEDLLKPIQAGLIVVVAAFYWHSGCSPRRLAPFVAAAFLLFTLFNPVLWPYLYTPALVAALVAVVGNPLR